MRRHFEPCSKSDAPRCVEQGCTGRQPCSSDRGLHKARQRPDNARLCRPVWQLSRRLPTARPTVTPCNCKEGRRDAEQRACWNTLGVASCGQASDRQALEKSLQLQRDNAWISFRRWPTGNSVTGKRPDDYQASRGWKAKCEDVACRPPPGGQVTGSISQTGGRSEASRYQVTADGPARKGTRPSKVDQ